MKKKMILNGQEIKVGGNGGASYTAGEGVTIEDDTVSVTTPVRGIYTLNQWNALPEAERSKGLYIVDDGQGNSGGSGGVTFIPSVSEEGELSWTNNGDLENPEPVNIKGPPGADGQDGAQGPAGTPGANATINGQNTLEIVAGDNVEVEQSDETLTISVPEVYSTEETVIGRWIDGKPLYRKVVEFTTGTTDNQHLVARNVVPSVADIKKIDATLHGTNGSAGCSFSNGYYSANASARFNIFYFADDRSLYDNIGGLGMYGASGIAILTYTKTTDQATVQLTSQSIQTAALNTSSLPTTAVTGSNTEVTL